MMKIKLLSLLILIIFVSCKEEKQPEIISFDELAGIEETDAMNDSAEQNNLMLANTPIDLFTQSQLVAYDTFPHKEKHVLDRFGYNQTVKRDFIGKNKVKYGKTNEVTPVASIFYYTFSDSLKTKNAFYNWLDCYGADCNEIKLYEDIQAIKTPPMFTVVYDTVIVAVEYKCEHTQNDWKTFENSIINHFGENYKYSIAVDCGGPLVWKK